MASYTVAILGRPNVGKSTLFNRLVGYTHSIVSPEEGVTRDRIYGTCEWSGNEFNLIDTGGYIPGTEDRINKHVRLQADIALDEADVLLLLVNGRSLATSSEQFLSEIIKKSGKPFLLVANKIDDISHENDALSYYELGMGNPITVSAQGGRKSGDLLDEIVKLLPDNLPSPSYENHINVAIVGMPNVGKSSLMNTILKEDKSIVTDIAGTTRDSVDSYIKYFGRSIRLIDTAGLRRKAKIKDSVEFYSTVRTNRVIADCDLSILMVDADKGFDKQDKDIARSIIDAGKGLIIVVNKWDLIEKDTNTMKDFIDEIEYRFTSMQHYPILFISVKNNLRIGNILEELLKVYDRRSLVHKTAELNKFIEVTSAKFPPPAVKGKNLTIKYVTQVHHSPPIFVFYSNFPDLYPISYKRYIENQLRQKFDLLGSPIRISFRQK